MQLLCYRNFIKPQVLEEKNYFIQVFSKQHGLASQDSLVVGSVGWEFYGVASTSPASMGGGVSRHVNIRVGIMILLECVCCHYMST